MISVLSFEKTSTYLLTILASSRWRLVWLGKVRVPSSTTPRPLGREVPIGFSKPGITSPIPPTSAVMLLLFSSGRPSVQPRSWNEAALLVSASLGLWGAILWVGVCKDGTSKGISSVGGGGDVVGRPSSIKTLSCGVAALEISPILGAWVLSFGAPRGMVFRGGPSSWDGSVRGVIRANVEKGASGMLKFIKWNKKKNFFYRNNNGSALWIRIRTSLYIKRWDNTI